MGPLLVGLKCQGLPLLSLLASRTQTHFKKPLPDEVELALLRHKFLGR